MTRSVAVSRSSLDHLAEASLTLARNLSGETDWMSAANADSAQALGELASEAATAHPPQAAAHSVEDLKTPLLAAIGAADLALATVNEIVASLRERADDARSDANDRYQQSIVRLAKLREGLPVPVFDLSETLSTEELRKAAEVYAEAAAAAYNSLIERGESALEHLRALAGGFIRVKYVTDQAEDAPSAAGPQIYVLGGRSAKLVGVEVPKTPAKAAPVKKAAPAAKVPGKKAAARKAPAKKAAAKRSVRK
jgi:heparin binding hemagglutinin HbhA